MSATTDVGAPNSILRVLRCSQVDARLLTLRLPTAVDSLTGRRIKCLSVVNSSAAPAAPSAKKLSPTSGAVKLPLTSPPLLLANELPAAAEDGVPPAEAESVLAPKLGDWPLGAAEEAACGEAPAPPVA